MIEGLRRAQIDAESRIGIESHLIMCFLRDHSAESAHETLEQAAPYRDWIIGVGLDSNEYGNPPSKFADVYAAAAAEGYRLTMHCDVDQENSVAHIWQAIDDIGVERIDHGVNALEERSLIREFVNRRIGQTVCPISNRYVVADSRSRDIKQMLDEGMRPTVNSDDPAYFRGYMNDNLAVAQSDGDLTAQEVGQLMRKRLRHELDDRHPQAGLPRRARRLPRRLSRSVEQLGATGNNPPGESPVWAMGG